MNNLSHAQTFRHRQNLDGTWDSICMRCYLTAAHVITERLLTSAESGHRCDESSWLFQVAVKGVGVPVGSRPSAMERLSIPSRACPPSAMPRSRQAERLQFRPQGRQIWHSGRPAGLREPVEQGSRAEA
jgi:hypothetical protein